MNQSNTSTTEFEHNWKDWEGDNACRETINQSLKVAVEDLDRCDIKSAEHTPGKAFSSSQTHISEFPTVFQFFKTDSARLSCLEDEQEIAQYCITKVKEMQNQQEDVIAPEKKSELEHEKIYIDMIGELIQDKKNFLQSNDVKDFDKFRHKYIEITNLYTHEPVFKTIYYKDHTGKDSHINVEEAIHAIELDVQLGYLSEAYRYYNRELKRNTDQLSRATAFREGSQKLFQTWTEWDSKLLDYKRVLAAKMLDEFGASQPVAPAPVATPAPVVIPVEIPQMPVQQPVIPQGSILRRVIPSDKFEAASPIPVTPPKVEEPVPVLPATPVPIPIPNAPEPINQPIQEPVIPATIQSAPKSEAPQIPTGRYHPTREILDLVNKKEPLTEIEKTQLDRAAKFMQDAFTELTNIATSFADYRDIGKMGEYLNYLKSRAEKPGGDSLDLQVSLAENFIRLAQDRGMKFARETAAFYSKPHSVQNYRDYNTFLTSIQDGSLTRHNIVATQNAINLSTLFSSVSSTISEMQAKQKGMTTKPYSKPVFEVGGIEYIAGKNLRFNAHLGSFPEVQLQNLNDATNVYPPEMKEWAVNGLSGGSPVLKQVLKAAHTGIPAIIEAAEQAGKQVNQIKEDSTKRLRTTQEAAKKRMDLAGQTAERHFRTLIKNIKEF